jgi:uncharacterized protein (TIGR03663 family)
VATASTKRGRKSGAQRRGASRNYPPVATAREAADARAALGGEIPERAWRVGAALIMLAATLLRVVALGMKPLHHDEGVNGFFLTNLMREGRYAYDPANYHGPTLYYLTLPLSVPADYFHFMDAWVLRAVPVLFGVGTVWLLLRLRSRVGAVAALSAAALVAVSPACVFYSRYFIHEMPFVFFTVGLVVAALRFYETGEGAYLLLASASAAMLFATKETAFISLGTLGLAWLSAYVWEVLWRGGARARGAGGAGGREFLSRPHAPAYAAGAVVLFVFIWVAFYSSFFTNGKGVWDSFKAFDLWKQTGMSEFHGKPWDTYLRWLIKEDAPALALGALGAVLALFGRGRNRFALFAAAWGFGLLAAYSLISYKTPWLALNFIVPLAVAGGYAVQEAGGWTARDEGAAWDVRRVAALAVFAAALALNLYQTYVVNFREYDDDRHPYVYSQTRRELFGLVEEVRRLGERAGTKEPGLATASPDYWPLPWYFRDNTRAGYEGHLSSSYDPNKTHVVIGKEEQLPQLQRVLGDSYVRVGDLYPLRPGVNLVIYERRDLAPK